MEAPMTTREQLALLQQRGLTVEQPSRALERLQQVNYFRLKGYLLPFRRPDGSYLPGTTFERVYRLYVFDSRLRGLLFPVLSEIELTLRTKLGYYHAHKYGALGYLDGGNYARGHNHKRFLQTVRRAVRDKDNQPLLQSHVHSESGDYPVWVILELLSMGGLACFLADLPQADRQAVAKDCYGLAEEVLCSWTDCFTQLRNAVAHYSRLYYAPFADTPLEPAGLPFSLGHQLFDYLYVCRGLYLHRNRWNITFLPALVSLLEEYADDIELSHIGFPENWKEQLALEAP